MPWSSSCGDAYEHTAQGVADAQAQDAKLLASLGEAVEAEEAKAKELSAQLGA